MKSIRSTSHPLCAHSSSPKTPPSSRRSKTTSRFQSARIMTQWQSQSLDIEATATPSRRSLAQSASVTRHPFPQSSIRMSKTRGASRNLTCFCGPLARSQRRSPSQATSLSRLRYANRQPRHQLVRETLRLRRARHRCPQSASKMTPAPKQALEPPTGPPASTSCRCK